MFEHPFGGLLTGTISTLVEDPSGISPPSSIIQTDDAWQVVVSWNISGIAAMFLGGNWTVRVFVESIGPGPEVQVGTTQVVPLSAAPPATSRSYNTTMPVGAGVLPEGSYKLVTLLNYENAGVSGEMAAFVESPIVQIIPPGP